MKIIFLYLYGDFIPDLVSMKKTIFVLVLCFNILSVGFGQQPTDLKEVFAAAESYYLFEEFEEALPLYLRLHRTYPENYNLHFKIGVCYLNNAYEKEKSVSFLEKASLNINPKYKGSHFKEMGAPLESMYYLGNAYRINNELDNARDAYKRFQSQVDSEIYNVKLVEEQLSACNAAEKLMKKPVDIDAEILSNQVNTRFADQNPAISGDETKMVFISKLQFYDAVFFTEKKNGSWSYPRNITPELGVDGDVYPTCLSYDGNLLFVYRNDDFIGNIYTSSLVNGVWSPLVKLNENINTKYWESHAAISKDGNTLYFTSNRKDGYGGLDIYKSTKSDGDDWGIPVNLGASINSAYNEETPFITQDGSRLFFASYGHYNMGGYDIFMSIRQPDNSWTSPVNLGYPINSPDDDVFFCPVRNGEIAYYPIYRESGYGKHDIYRIQIYTADHPRKFEITGTLEFPGEDFIGSDVEINVIRQGTGDTIASINPDDSGKFGFSVTEGNYSVIFEGKRFEKEIKFLEINRNTPHSGFSFNEKIKLFSAQPKLTPEEINQNLQNEDSLRIGGSDDEAIELNFEAEKGSFVIVKQLVDSNLVKSDTLQVDKPNQSYEFEPQPDNNLIKFTPVDEDENQVIKTMNIENPDEEELIPDLPDNQYNNEVPNEMEIKGNELIQSNIQTIINDLSTRSDSNLNIALENLDLSKTGISNTDELFRYLHENNEQFGYTDEEVDNLFIEINSKKEKVENTDLRQLISDTKKSYILSRGQKFTITFISLLGITFFLLILLRRKKELEKNKV
jgi:tetratricopeptide (TPR) repeat protein